MKKKLKRSVVEATAGSLKTNRKGPPLSERELKEAAEIAIAEDAMRRAGMPWRRKPSK